MDGELVEARRDARGRRRAARRNRYDTACSPRPRAASACRRAPRSGRSRTRRRPSRRGASPARAPASWFRRGSRCSGSPARGRGRRPASSGAGRRSRGAPAGAAEGPARDGRRCRSRCRCSRWSVTSQPAGAADDPGQDGQSDRESPAASARGIHRLGWLAHCRSDMQLGRLGVWTWLDHLAMHAPQAADVHERQHRRPGLRRRCGFPEAVGREPFSPARLPGRRRRARASSCATGIANIYARDAVTMHARPQDPEPRLSGGPLACSALGVSHSHLVAGRARARVLEQAGLGDARLPGRGWSQGRYTPASGRPPSRRPHPAGGAASQNMLASSPPRSTRGAHPYFVPPEHTARAREILGPDAILAVPGAEGAALCTDATKARAIGPRGTMQVYTRACPTTRTTCAVAGLRRVGLRRW